MGQHIGADKAGGGDALVGQGLEQVEHALARLAGLAEKGGGGLVRRGLLGPGIGEQAALRHALAAHHQRLAALGRRGVPGHGGADHGGGTEQGRGDRHVAGLAELVVHARKMAAGDVARLMRQHADHLVRRLGLLQQPGMDEDALAFRHEGVDGRAVDQIHMDRAGGETRHPEDVAGVNPQQPLDFGVADEGRLVVSPRRHQRSLEHDGQSGCARHQFSQEIAGLPVHADQASVAANCGDTEVIWGFPGGGSWAIGNSQGR